MLSYFTGDSSSSSSDPVTSPSEDSSVSLLLGSLPTLLFTPVSLALLTFGAPFDLEVGKQP